MMFRLPQSILCFDRRHSARPNRVFGLYVGSQRLELAIATELDQGRYQLEFDYFYSGSGADWLSSENLEDFTDVFRSMVEKHQMRKEHVAVSLDGDHCVTRVVMGVPEHVDKELELLLDRSARYLSLGPGRKIAGIARQRLEAGTDYAAAAVINETVIERLYGVLLRAELRIQWVEPSLVSLARLVDASHQDTQEPVLLADGIGSKWNLGIVQCGRLLLDYRPSAAKSVDEIQASTASHIDRLRRFCTRHRNIAGGTLSRVMIACDEGLSEQASQAFEKIEGLSATIIRDDQALAAVQFGGDHQASVSALSAVLPMLIGTPSETVPDMLSAIRREGPVSWRHRLLRDGWPAIAAVVFLMCGYTILSAQRIKLAYLQAGIETIELQVEQQNRLRMLVSQQSEKINHLQRIEAATEDTPWSIVLKRITQCLPDPIRVNQLLFDDQQGLRMDGTSQDESVIYDYLAHLRRLPEVEQVALQGTSPLEAGTGVNFRTVLQIASPEPRRQRLTSTNSTNSASEGSTKGASQ